MTQKDFSSDPAITPDPPVQKQPDFKTKHPKALNDLPIKLGTESQQVTSPKPQTLPYTIAHQLLTHPGQNTVRNTAKYYNWTLQGTTLPCEPCISEKGHKRMFLKL